MIYTVTLNPAVDYYLSMDKFIEGELNSLKDAYTLPGGKGINVSKVLKNFGVESITLGFIGGFTGEYIRKNIEEYGIQQDFVKIKEDTRINIKMKTNEKESEISGKAPNISKEEYKIFLEKIKNIKSGDILVLSGSIPKSLPKDVYVEIIRELPSGVKVIVDTRGDSLKDVLKEGVFLVKPNNHELEEFFGEKYFTDEEIIEAGKKLMKLGSENVLISLGKDGSILITKNGVYRGNVPKGKLISSVGAGDSMVAGVLYGINRGEKIEDVYKYGIASGSSTAFSEGLTTFENMKKLLNEIEIKII
ncbi:MAG: 1-phosphofructokinase [Fusobacterium perfoetens]|uniref:1-phosphofructokinase n=1 Tax=Fusobacterium perfoetens TaxID=852 RepID=UPI0023F1B7F8|nr:1-phosphofructokinase [Fusobacterium perfoetens]MCI6153247.1 1-phosphofructokinase [Fusobacterium perfoetens]MDY3238348.1 1-phosphofructokinase [Fusobacterium perfoetens]